MSDALAETEPDAGNGASAGSEPPPLLHGCPLVDSLGASVVLCDREGYFPLMSALKEDGFPPSLDRGRAL
jgi:hypothetical protein